MPKNKNQWVQINSNRLIIEKQAYWFLPSNSQQKSGNKDNVTIKIPETQIINETTFPQLFDSVYSYTSKDGITFVKLD